MYIEPHSSQYITMSFCNKNLETFFFLQILYQEKYKTL